MKNYAIIAFEGHDYSGKSTRVAELAERLRENQDAWDVKVLEVKAPYYDSVTGASILDVLNSDVTVNSEVYEDGINKALYYRAAVYALNRAKVYDDIHKAIAETAEDEFLVVLMDRSFLSSLTQPNCTTVAIEEVVTKAAHKLLEIEKSVPNYIAPDNIQVMDITLDELERRIETRVEEQDAFENYDYIVEARQRYRALPASIDGIVISDDCWSQKIIYDHIKGHSSKWESDDA